MPPKALASPVLVVVSLLLFGCSSKTAAPMTDGSCAHTEAAALTPAEIRMMSPAQIVDLGTSIKCLSDAALAALTLNNSAASGQIAAITAAQIVVLTPAQVRLLGAAGEGGSITTSKVGQLNTGAWSALVQSMDQVAAFTAAEVPTFSPPQIVALGTNIKFLSNAALAALTLNNSAASGQIAAITAAQIVVLTPAQVRLLGAAGEGGSITTSRVGQLNTGAWAALVQSMDQVAAFTAAEVPTFSPPQIVALGTNIKLLSNAALAALTLNNSAATGQIAAITAAQIVVLTPAQVRLLGAAGEGGSITTSKVGQLNMGAWAALFQSMDQVAAITAAEVPTFSPPQIVALGTNIKFVTNAALAALTANNSAATGQIAALVATQVMALSPEQIGVIAAAHDDTGVALLNMGAFASLTPAQIAILTTTQRAKLSPAQHTSCGC